ncbi:MAG: hypothetical protein ACRC6A_00355 [Fusobacteriaceae bacterium]
MNKINAILKKYWEIEKVNQFYETLQSKVLSYKVECLEYFIEDIFRENPKIKSSEIIKLAQNMDAFINAEEFLIDFFRCTETPEGEAVIARLENDSDEVQRLVEGLVKSKKIRVKENENEFIVMYV